MSGSPICSNPRSVDLPRCRSPDPRRLQPPRVFFFAVMLPLRAKRQTRFGKSTDAFPASGPSFAMGLGAPRERIGGGRAAPLLGVAGGCEAVSCPAKAPRNAFRSRFVACSRCPRASCARLALFPLGAIGCPGRRRVPPRKPVDASIRAFTRARGQDWCTAGVLETSRIAPVRAESG